MSPSVRVAACRSARSLALVLALLAAAPCLALNGPARLRQNATELTVTPLQNGQSVAAFYSYDVPNASCANTGLETAATSLLFLHEDVTTFPSPLSLVVIHDLPNNRGGGEATMDVSGLPPLATYSVLDDSFDVYTTNPPTGGQTTALSSWSTCCTDGFAISGLETAPFCVAIQPTFTLGIMQWQALDGPSASSPRRSAIPSLVDTVYLCGDCETLTCPGTITAECATGSTAFVAARASGTSACGGEVVTNTRTAGGLDASDDYPLGVTRITYTMVDGPGFVATCSTDVVVQNDTSPPVITNCPESLVIDCAGPGGVPASDPVIQAWLATFAAVDACGTVTLRDDAPALFPSACNATTTLVTFEAEDEIGNVATCMSRVTIYAQCLALPRDVGPALRVRDHGDPLAPLITATLDWSRDEGLPRPADEHYHVRGGTDPQALPLLAGIEPWTAVTLDESTPAATTLPLVHYYVVNAAGPCEDVSLD